MASRSKASFFKATSGTGRRIAATLSSAAAVAQIGWPNRLRPRERQPRPAALPLDLADALAGRAADYVVPLVQHRLQPGDRLRRVCRDLGSELQRRFLGRRGRRDTVDKAEAECLVGADRTRGEQQVLG